MLCQALKLIDFFALAKVGPAAEQPVTELVLDYIQSIPQHARALQSVSSVKDPIERRLYMHNFASFVAKWFNRRMFVEPVSEDEGEEDRIWARIQLYTCNNQ